MFLFNGKTALSQFKTTGACVISKAACPKIDQSDSKTRKNFWTKGTTPETSDDFSKPLNDKPPKLIGGS